MIDFPTLFPSLVKYIPNWMEKFYPRMAQFARGEGYPCGNKGVFIPRRNKCWTHPKTGQRMRKPLTYQNYQDAKEKSQKSRTEKGRTALANREQSFRDKAREKAKGWQNKKPQVEVSELDKKSFEGLSFTKLSSAQQWLDLQNNAKIASKSPNQSQKEYDSRQPDLNIDSGLGMTEGWRTDKLDGSVRGIPWLVKMENKENPSIIAGARLKDHAGSNKIKKLELHTTDGKIFGVEFKKGNRDASLRARRFVKEIAQGKTQEMEFGDIKALIEEGKDGLAKRKVEKARLAAEDKQFKAALDDYLKSKNLTRESIKGLTDIGMDDLIEKVEKYQKSQSQTPNSTGAKIAGGKSVDQQYKDIIAKSKDPKATEEEVSMALMRGLPDFHRDSYNEYSTAIKNNTVPKGYENHYREKVDRFKPVVDNEDFINERRKKAIKGDYETENEARVYVLNKMKEKGYKEHEYYDSPDYEKDYDKLKGVMKTKDVPPPLSGSVPSKDLRKTLNPGDKLFVKSFVSERLSNPSDYRIADGGEVLKVNIKNAKVRSRGISPLNGKPYDVEGVATLNEISHVIRDGKRYKVDDSDRSPNDLGIPESAKPKAGSAREMVGTVKVKIDPKEPAPPTPKLKSKDHAANEKYDQWLISKSQELEGKEKNYNIVTESGKKSVKGKVYENFGIHEERGRYNLTQLSSGRMLNYYDDEDLAKKSIIELNRSGIDWKLNEKELQNIPGIQTKMKSVKRKIGAVIESDKRAKELIESMMRSHEKESWDRSDDLAGYGVKVPKKQKNNFNSNLKLANFAKPGCCCEASKPLKRRKTKQTPRLKRRGNRYA